MENRTEELKETIGRIINDAMYYILDEDDSRYLAEELIDKGYRKASEVALEVIGEINDNFDQMVNEAENTIMDAIQEGNLTAARIARYGKDVIILARNTLTKMLEKKYTEVEG